MQVVLTPELLIEAYRQGLFPMSYGADSPYVHWVCPEQRGQLSIENLHISKSLKKAIRKNLNGHNGYRVKTNTAFEETMRACAQSSDNRPETWINEHIIEAYCKLHARGVAHSVECWDGNVLIGGLYGVSIGGAFFGESMFSRKPNASKIALVHLCARLWHAGYQLLDTQFINDHLLTFGAYEIDHEVYIQKLTGVLSLEVSFECHDMPEKKLIEQYLTMRSDRKTVIEQ